jgi:SAM-dependent methyltransferase
MLHQVIRTIGHGACSVRQVTTRVEVRTNLLEADMETALEQIRNQQHATWNKFSAGWKKWDGHVLPWLAPAAEALLEAARLRPASYVLDVASGTGEPGLSAAARCPQGRVVITDLAEKMLSVAEENAARRGLTNVETRLADAGALPFADGTFDAVIARFGFMFFPDVAGAAREFARVARPGARVTTAVWAAPEKNAWATTIMSTIAKHVDLPPPPPGAPGLFRCAAPGYMGGVFRDAGLRDVTDKEVAVPIQFDEPEAYFTFMNEVAAPVVAGMAKADEAARARIKAAVLGLAAAQAKGGKVRLDGTAIVITGEK